MASSIGIVGWNPKESVDLQEIRDSVRAGWEDLAVEIAVQIRKDLDEAEGKIHAN